MNIHTPEFEREPTRDEAAHALGLLRHWAEGASEAEIATLDPMIKRLLPGGSGAAYPALSRAYPDWFRADAAYRDTLPDLQNGPESLIKGARRRIEHVGISNFRLPLRFATRAETEVMLETSVTGTVSLEAEKKGINMSRIMRSFYGHADEAVGFGVIEAALADYRRDLGSFDARIQLRFSYPLKVLSLRSGLAGWQYYDVSFEVLEQAGVCKRLVHLDYVYSSTCPCSLELSEHARRERGQLATPHSQRSVARISVEVLEGAELFVEDIVEIARTAVPTETQVMVKREDEQAFAELNAAYPIFVEDAARLFAAGLMADARVGDFRVVASHQESLHSHDAVAVLVEGETFAGTGLEPRLFGTLVHAG